MTAPARLAVKGILEISIPKAAPFFLYLFVTDKAEIEKLPSKVKSKREKASKIADFIVNAIGMKRDHLMGIIRNGIEKKYGKAPERVIELQKTGQISGIGFIDLGSSMTELQKTISTLQLTSKLKAPLISKDMFPEAADWPKQAAAAPAAKVDTAGTRKFPQLAAKIPDIAPFFLYLFIKDDEIVEDYPAVKAKRAKQAQLADYLVSAIGISREQFMALLRQGLIKRYNAGPEQILANISQNKVSGIGFVIAEAVSILWDIVTTISKFFGKKIDVSKDDSPDVADWSGADGLTAQKILEQPGRELDNEYKNGGSIWDTLKF
jgi:hypothetical protein